MTGSIILLWNLVAILTIISIALLMGKGSFLIAGYNTASKETRQTFNEKRLCRVVGGGLSVVTLVLAIATFYEFELPIVIAWIIPWGLLVPVALIVILVMTICRVKPNSDSIEEIEYRGIKKTTSLAILVVIGIVLGIYLYFGEADPTVNISDNSILIKARFGTSINTAEITNISIIESNMNDIGTVIRTNGYSAFGAALKGNFKSDELGEIMLFVNKTSSPTIFIARENARNIYISLNNSEATRKLYLELLQVFSLK